MAQSKPDPVNCCAYRNCTNQRGDSVVPFSFPNKKTEKLARWIQKAGK